MFEKSFCFETNNAFYAFFWKKLLFLEKRVYGQNHIVLTIRDETLEYPEEDENYGDLWCSFVIREQYTYP